jgi:hypothetical protein
MHSAAIKMPRGGVEPFERNRYYYGKMLDAFHFDMETGYQNEKRWLINRMVLGHGVVCGLDVVPGDAEHTIVVTPGLAIDKWGREIVVSRRSPPIQIPADVLKRAASQVDKGRGYDGREKPAHDDRCIQVMVCYQECETDPTPVLAGDCRSAEECAAGTIREGYQVKFTEKLERPTHDVCRIPHIVSQSRIDFEALVKWVTRERDCFCLPRESCIRLAHVRVSEKGGHCHHDDIDISVRPIVYSNDLLFDIFLGWQTPGRGAAEK